MRLKRHALFVRLSSWMIFWSFAVPLAIAGLIGWTFSGMDGAGCG